MNDKCFYFQYLTKRDEPRLIRNRAKCRFWMEN